MARLVSTNPATGAVLGEVEISTPADIAAAIAAVRENQPAWCRQGIDGRAAAIRRLTALFTRERAALSAIMTLSLVIPMKEGFLNRIVRKESN